LVFDTRRSLEMIGLQSESRVSLFLKYNSAMNRNRWEWSDARIYDDYYYNDDLLPWSERDYRLTTYLVQSLNFFLGRNYRYKKLKFNMKSIKSYASASFFLWYGIVNLNTAPHITHHALALLTFHINKSNQRTSL
jgi:hypothetical protein